jgi:hypothetical protein
LKLKAALCVVLTLVVSPVTAEQDGRVKQATDLILKLCLASGVENVEINTKSDSIEVSGKGSSLQINRRESAGLVGGISKEITALSAQQASEARVCTQRYMGELLDAIMKDEPRDRVRTAPGTIAGSVKNDPEAFWGGRGIWEDNQNYCKELRDFVSVNMSDLRYSENGETVSRDNITPEPQKIEHNYLLKTEPGSRDQLCSVYVNQAQHYYGLQCRRMVSFGKLDVFSSVYNQTLKDMRDCLLPAGYTQMSDQGSCIPYERNAARAPNCIRSFTDYRQSVWLFSDYYSGGSLERYSIGIEALLAF